MVQNTFKKSKVSNVKNKQNILNIISCLGNLNIIIVGDNY